MEMIKSISGITPRRTTARRCFFGKTSPLPASIILNRKGAAIMQLTGAQIVIECMKEQGVDTIFGYPGGAILNIYDELYKHSDEIRHILVSHEQGASHAADGYARATGKTAYALRHRDLVPRISLRVSRRRTLTPYRSLR